MSHRMLCAFGILLAVGTVSAMRAEDTPAPAKPKFDMSVYRTLTEDALKLVKAGDMPGAYKKTLELEKKFDDNTKDLKAADRKIWKAIDVQMDVAIDACKGDKPDPEKATKALTDFNEKLGQAEQIK